MSDNKWSEVRNQCDVDNLMHKFGNFSKCCLKELRYVSKQRKVYMIFQRQEEEIPAIEVMFEGVDCLLLNPLYDEYSPEISSAYIVIEDGYIVWFDSADFEEEYEELYEYIGVSWIKAECMKWREADEFIGEEEFY